MPKVQRSRPEQVTSPRHRRRLLKLEDPQLGSSSWNPLATLQRVAATPGRVPAEDVVALQRAIGNQGTQRQVVQRKRTSKVKKGDIVGILAKVQNEDLRKELTRVANTLITQGTLWFDDDATSTFAQHDPTKGEIVVHIPQMVWWQSNDMTIEKEGITIHELTHAAEVVANTGGDFSKTFANPNAALETDLVKLSEITDHLLDLVNAEQKTLDAIKYESTSSPLKTMYGYLLERINYAHRHLTHSTSSTSKEVPTVINQVIYVIDQKAPGIKSTTLYDWLIILQNQLLQSRTARSVKTPVHV